MRRADFAILAAILFVLRASTARAENPVIDLPLASGETQRVLYLASGKPRGTLVMLPGGAGDIGISPDGTLRHGDNFLVRTRDEWAAHGYAVMIPDALGGQNLRGVRSTPAYAAVVAALVARARTHALAKGPVFLVGTSQGSIAAMNGAAHAAPGTIAGIVLTESVSRLGGSHETVFSADPAKVRVPALVVANRDDACNVAPPADAPRIAAAMVHAPDVDIIVVTGGTTRSDRACGSLTPHGYYGIEPDVIEKITQWLDAHS